MAAFRGTEQGQGFTHDRTGIAPEFGAATSSQSCPGDVHMVSSCQKMGCAEVPCHNGSTPRLRLAVDTWSSANFFFGAG
jgi:hypothetical protein